MKINSSVAKIICSIVKEDPLILDILSLFPENFNLLTNANFSEECKINFIVRRSTTCWGVWFFESLLHMNTYTIEVDQDCRWWVSKSIKNPNLAYQYTTLANNDLEFKQLINICKDPKIKELINFI